MLPRGTQRSGSVIFNAKYGRMDVSEAQSAKQLRD